MLPIVFGLLTSLCFRHCQSPSATRLPYGPAPWGPWITIAGNAAFLLAAHLLIEADTRFLADNFIFVAVGLFVPGSPGC